MKKIFFIVLLFLTSSAVSFAQIDQQELELEIEQMEKQMSEAFKMLELTFQDGQLLQEMDTLLFKMLPDADQPATVYPNGDPYELHQMMDQLMGVFREENRLEMEKFFEDFEQRLPDMEHFEEEETTPGQKQGETKQKKRKKTRIYTL